MVFTKHVQDSTECKEGVLGLLWVKVMELRLVEEREGGREGEVLRLT